MWLKKGWHLLVFPKILKFISKNLPSKILFGYQQNLAIPGHFLFKKRNLKKFPKFSESIIQIKVPIKILRDKFKFFMLGVI